MPAWLSAYDRVVLGRPRLVLALLALLVGFFGYWIKDFRLDASADSLVLEQDEDVRYYRRISERYATDDFVFITYTPNAGLFSQEALSRLKSLRDALKRLPRVDSVNSLLDVPLLKNPPGTLKELADNIKSLEDDGADIEMAKAELKDSPIYTNLIVSENLESTAIQVTFTPDENGRRLQKRRTELRDKLHDETITQDEQNELVKVEAGYRASKIKNREFRHEDIAAIRATIDKHRDGARIFLGGVPMIVDDIIAFIKKDLKVFGVGMMAFLILALGVIFRRKRWVVLPLLSCAASVIMMMGLLGFSGWEVTVVSSNFISLQLIFTMSLAIHIIVRYREALRASPDADNHVLIREAVGHTFVPCLYASLTTIAGFTSLVFCDILPVMNFGYMMTGGLLVSLVVTFHLIPSGLMLMSKPKAEAEAVFGAPVTALAARITERNGPAIFAVSILLGLATVVGVTRLEVENSFIDYFKKSTEIYRGMAFIDRNLGGTTALDVIISFPEAAAPVPVAAETEDDSFDEFAEFEEEEDDPRKYWFTTSKLELVEKVHDFMVELPATGKVLSLATLWKTTRDLNEGKPFDHFANAILFNSLPAKFNKVLVDPYVSVIGNQARITTRIKDSLPGLRRNAMLRQVRKDLQEKFDLGPERVRLSGIMVLYNNMLQSLFQSQIKTIGYTVVMLLAMFLLLFRSLKLALIALLPNLLSCGAVLGVMGLGGIPLDLMTITIVAISVGIAVDDTIHYIHRFRQEIELGKSYLESMKQSHRSIGNAMAYTTYTISVGFSILVFSNFVPSILFGLLTALAMTMALIAALTLLPRLILWAEPFGPAKGQVVH